MPVMSMPRATTQQCFGEVHTVDHQGHQVELGQGAAQKLGQGGLGGADEAPRDRGESSPAILLCESGAVESHDCTAPGWHRRRSARTINKAISFARHGRGLAKRASVCLASIFAGFP